MPFNPQTCFCRGQCRATESLKLQLAGETEKALMAARHAVLQAPRCPYTHGALGHMMALTHNAAYARRHINISDVLGDRPAVAKSQMGHCLIQLGDVAGAEAAFTQALLSNPNHMPAHMGLAKVAELQRDYEKAVTLCEQVYGTNPAEQGIGLLYGHNLAAAGQELMALEVLAVNPDAMMLYESGKIREKEGDYAGAWRDYTAANLKTGKVYQAEDAARRIGNHKLFATISQLERLPKLTMPIGKPVTPLFITGYPRSGTTLLETMLSQHDQIHAGDELRFIQDIAGFSQAWLSAEQIYPFSLAELAIGDKMAILRAFRAYYISKAMDIGTGGKTFITDKMPLNEMHLPLISMIFAEAPILHVRRHPLDVVVSNFATYLTHGFNQSFGLESAAIHYARVDDLVQHYRNKVEMNYMEVRYEEIITQTEAKTKEILLHLALPFDARCTQPETSPNHPRTPSYEAVKRPINDSSVGRWKNFEAFLAPALAILSPILEREHYQ